MPASPDGYIILGQFIYRISGINNLITSSSIGATYTAEIPGNRTVTNGPENNSATFIGNDLIVVCAGSPLNYSFAAKDGEGDQLRYSFCDAYQGGISGAANSSLPPAAPPYQAVPYTSPYTGLSPLDNKVNIDLNTGYITGTAPKDAGIYVVTVCVSELRNGTVISTQRKDIQLNIAPCTIAGAKLKPEYMLCRDTKTISLSNLSVSPLIVTQHWELFDNKGTSLFNADTEKINYTFPDTGIYTIKLIVNKNRECTDSTTAIARVYPGFILDFNWSGVCYKKPTTFINATTSVYGQANSWDWEFGEQDIGPSFSDKKDPSFTYKALGSKNVRLIAGNTYRCIDTIIKDIVIFDKPLIKLAFSDTLICVKDILQLQASGSGIFSWSPVGNLVNGNSSGPTVWPAATTTYYVNLDDDGCLNRDSVKVQVTDHVSLQIMQDTTICSGDTVQLRVISDGFKYAWSPASQTINPSIKNASVITSDITEYRVVSSIGGCAATASVKISPVPYPLAYAGADTVICFKSFAQLHGVFTGASFNWSPGSPGANSILKPVVRPLGTTSYIFSVYDTRGCPKPGRDTIVVTVLPKIQAFAGRDTAVVVNQPFKLQANGGASYRWSPSTGLSATNVASPIAIYTQSSEAILYKLLAYDPFNCVDSAFVKVKVFKTGPSIFVPTAFSPGG